MNFEFPFKELPAILCGPRVERRRVLIGGSAFWGTIIESTAARSLNIASFAAS
jgi:5-oxopent-3-ene-1,2,5-tricarboxylate decarboxylase / 2-hydroxyhepta-2,4-diene-1,7-dioate isomerase